MPDLDIVIVNWNSGAQLRDCLQSLQDLPAGCGAQIARCIVVDNASSDDSAQGLPQYRLPLTLLHNTTNLGFGAACNMGALAGRAGLILFLNPDVRIFPDSLSTGASYLEQPECARVGILGMQLVDDQGVVQPSAARFPTTVSLVYQMIGLDRAWPARFPPQVMTDWDHAQTMEVDAVQGALLLVRRTAFSAVAGFDERFFMYYEDVDLAYRMRQAGWKTAYLANARAYHKGGGATENIKAGRLFYWFRSRVKYAAAHLGRWAGLGVILASFSLELVARLIWNILHGSWPHLRETFGAYVMYARSLPALLNT